MIKWMRSSAKADRMPTDAEHIAAATRNQELIHHLLPVVDRFPDWLAVVAFYKALHVVELMLFLDSPEKHAFNHERREDILKKTKRYEFVYKHYRPLWDASRIARYLSIGNQPTTRFIDLYPSRVVTERLIGHYLHQVESGVARLLGTKWPTSLPRCFKSNLTGAINSAPKPTSPE